jgi:hypothetical protein
MTQIQALTQALILALTAPSDQKAQIASELAEQIAHGLTKKQVNQCKVAAIKIWHPTRFIIGLGCCSLIGFVTFIF